MPPYIYHSATVAGPAAQDAFDVKLNQTIFAAAFGLGGLIFLGVLAYVSFWLVGRCSGRRDSKLDKIPPKALLLPTQLNEKTRASHASSSLFPGIGNDTEKLDLDAGMPQHGRRRFWFSKMRDTTADFMVPETCDSPPTQAPAIPPKAHVNARNTRSRFEFMNPSATSSAQVPAPSASVPRIVVEDLEPDAESDSFSRHSVSTVDSDSNISTEEKDPADELLAVPPMTWNAPRDMVDNDEKDGDAPGYGSNTPRSDPTQKPFSKRKNVLSLLANLSNATRRRPRLAPPVLDKNQAIAGAPLSRCLTRNDGSAL